MNDYNIIGNSKGINKVREDIKTVIKHNLPVIIYGESGTGKDIIAKALHFHGPRRDRRYCAINASCISETIAESELFGHVKGAFTGAINDHEGKFEFASKGTLFLDEIGCMSLKVQAKILRVIENKTFEKMGSNKTMRTNARIISASNMDLQEEVAKKNFREDLFYRISVFPIHVPPLRERKRDIPDLSRYFLSQCCILMKSEEKKIENDAMEKLMKYHWPGNIRELQNIIGVAVLKAKRDIISPEHFTFPNGHKDCEALSPMHMIADELERGEIRPFKEVELVYIKEAVRIYGGKNALAARDLKVSPRTLRNKLNSKTEEVED